MNFKPQCTTYADLLIRAGESVKMQEAAGLEPILRMTYGEYSISDCNLGSEPPSYEFPVGICEGKRVWRGDAGLYGKYTGAAYRVDEDETVLRVTLSRSGDNSCTDFNTLTWTPPIPPKPKTIDILGVDLEDAKVTRNVLGHAQRSMYVKSSSEFYKALDAAIKKAEA